MASTSNRNSSINYIQETNAYKHSVDHNLYLHNAYGEAFDLKTCGNGFNPGRMNCTHLSQNSIDIESFLRGIRSTDLTSPPFLQNPGITTFLSPTFKYPVENDLVPKQRTTIVPPPLRVDDNRPPFLR
jgi:hypothetical protein